MDKKLKAKWVKALMSGRYEQGHGALFSGGEYCCLGVLCKEMGESDERITGWGSTADIYGYSVPGDIDIEKGLADLNDAGIPFPVIAGFIQENL